MTRFTSMLPLLTLLGASAQAVTFGGLNISPRGAQNLNLQTGVTDMPQGGTVTDKKGGLTLVASRLQVKEGEMLQAQGVTLKTKEGGTLSAAQLRYDLQSGVVTASGNVSYADSRLKGVQASSLQLYLKTGFVVAQGGVKATTPDLSASALVFDTSTMRAVVAGPYVVSSQLGQLKGPAGRRILLSFAGSKLNNVAQRPTLSELNRFTPYFK